MIDKQVESYGSWKSPITSDLIVSETVRLGQIIIDGSDIYWLEARPMEKGRNVVVKQTSNGLTTDVTPPSFNARTRVHEYGGGAFTVSEGTVYFSNFADQHLYRQDPGKLPHPITPRNNLRYADGVVERHRNRLICIQEDHSQSEVINSLVSIDPNGANKVRLLASGNDFYSSPRISPNGSRLAWLTWNHPNMPWNGTELWVGQLNSDGSLSRTERVAGSADESIFQPEWSPEGILHFVSDRTGWWNLYRLSDGRVDPLIEMKAEFGVPQWVFGMSTYAFESADRILCTYVKEGIWHLASINLATSSLKHIDTPYTDIKQIRAAPGCCVFLGSSPSKQSSVIRLDLSTFRTKVLKRSCEVVIDEKCLSKPREIEFPTEHGLTAHAFYYAPRNGDYADPPAENPLLRVRSHGGPTSAFSSSLDLETQYWTSRGIAVLDVNYGGSTGYGREYRERLEGNWGITDVNDCVNGARYLAELGEVDEKRLMIEGGSAGGFTTLCALTFHDVFKAGASYYGVSDLESLTRDTHKFESHYLDRLIGKYPERRDLYYKRSPINFANLLSYPMIFFQGLEDKVVTPNQAETMVEALRKKGTPVAFIRFEGEQHGFRRAENIKSALESELYFYSKVFGFKLADRVNPVQIENL
ncbi:MAG TPA: S9 family peptidase [Thermoplasmata archaeon]|nr:S9 family peptidase [Thermoplasmata archaeon]